MLRLQIQSGHTSITSSEPHEKELPQFHRNTWNKVQAKTIDTCCKILLTGTIGRSLDSIMSVVVGN